jgi:hypothetical protein
MTEMSCRGHFLDSSSVLLFICEVRKYVHLPGEIIMFKKMSVFVASCVLAVSAIAVDASKVEKSVELKDGSTVYLFKDGKMAMEDKLGRIVRMKEGHVMETKDGQRVIMVGDEVARLDTIFKSAKGGGPK